MPAISRSFMPGVSNRTGRAARAASYKLQAASSKQQQASKQQSRHGLQSRTRQ
ncbi:hypothetical protein BSU04_44620 [Caballeronia sordidicola]|uniref:Uncharacterized protein n=1 Tax=Caballeronia sordidicola TaxID=196367 RepID=A0A226WM37_CABSO|nr:hypothetical protein BSU04_44620 [Caballeronia sordidicola]